MKLDLTLRWTPSHCATPRAAATDLPVAHFVPRAGSPERRVYSNFAKFSANWAEMQQRPSGRICDFWQSEVQSGKEKHNVYWNRDGSCYPISKRRFARRTGAAPIGQEADRGRHRLPRSVRHYRREPDTHTRGASPRRGD